MLYDILGSIGIKSMEILSIKNWHPALQLLSLFIFYDFIQWNIHRMLHKIPWLWRIHLLHHSAQQMNCSTHFRFHPLETIIYKSILFISSSLLGYSIDSLLLIHLFSICIGHLNHANINVSYGIFKFIFNHPNMHRWHHAKKLPTPFETGANFGISLSCWDYIFQTKYYPEDELLVEMGIQEHYPNTFWGQLLYPFRNSKT